MAKTKPSPAKAKKPAAADRKAGAKATKSAKPAKPAAKPAKAAAPAKPAKAAAPAKPAKAPAAPASAKAPAPAAPAPSAPPPADAAGTGPLGLRPKKKVKRGAPPMLPRRMARRPSTPAEGPPPPPRATSVGSLHTPARAPVGAELLKERLMKVTGDLARLRALKRALVKSFWDAGLLLTELSNPDMFRAKGYGSWESFVEREIEKELTIGRTQVGELMKIVRVFQRERAEELGLEKLRAALKVLYPDMAAASASEGASSSG